jgi:hypothetical protein
MAFMKSNWLSIFVGNKKGNPQSEKFFDPYFFYGSMFDDYRLQQQSGSEYR